MMHSYCVQSRVVTMQVHSTTEEDFVCHFILCLEPPEDTQSHVRMLDALVAVYVAVSSHHSNHPISFNLSV